MPIINVARLTKSYRVYQKQEGIRGSIRGLFRREFRDVMAVKGIDLSVEQGELVAFLGPNGAGKTTTLKLLSGVIEPTSGTATVMGHVPWKRENDYRRRFALVMGQKNQLWWDLPARESYRLHQHIYGIANEPFRQTLGMLTELLDVGRLLDQPVRELSLGERMKMELIAALLHDPEVLFLDEPTIGLDVVAQHSIQQFLKQYQVERKITILLTSHYMKDIAALCNRVVVIAGGNIRYDGSLSGIVDKFSGSKVVTLQWANTEEESLVKQSQQRHAIGEAIDSNWPKVSYRVPRSEVPRFLAEALRDHAVDDVVVEDAPLEEVIAELFRETMASSSESDTHESLDSSVSTVANPTNAE
ncbi:MAG: ABC transporter ATP-binding protein [Planctomycetota bacterium]